MYCSKCGYNNPISVRFCKNCEIDLAPNYSDHKKQDYTDKLIYSGLWERLIAAFLDLLVIGATVILVVFVLILLIAITGRESILHDQLILEIFSAWIIFFALSYYVLMESSMAGATFGKRWMNIRLQDIYGNKLSFPRATTRLLAKIFSSLLFNVGFITQPFTTRRQALYDLITRVVVTRTSDSKKISIMATVLVLFFAASIPVLAFTFTAGVPIFQQYVQKVQIETGIKIGRDTTLVVTRFYRNNGRVPISINEINRSIKSSPHIGEIVINQKNGETTLTFSPTVRNAIRNRHLIFTPTVEADQQINWKCHSQDIEVSILPSTCK